MAVAEGFKFGPDSNLAIDASALDLLADKGVPDEARQGLSADENLPPAGGFGTALGAPFAHDRRVEPAA
jgi:hypothetical protein